MTEINKYRLDLNQNLELRYPYTHENTDSCSHVPGSQTTGK